MASCMNQCSWFQPACFGVTYYTQNQTCSFKSIGINSSYASTTASDNVNVNSALVNVTQMAGLDPTCPYQNNSVINTSEGLPFHIYCNQDMGGIGDYFPWGVTDRAHTETMMECMELCSHAHPVCLGVSWNADLTSGYGNCYLKSSQGVPTTVGYVTHTGLVQLPIIDSCNRSTDEHPITTNDKTFNVSCYGGRSGSSNVTSMYSANITSCVDACADYSGSESCLGVWFDNSFADGFDNCYLLNDTGSDAGFSNSTFAMLASGTPSNSSSSPSTSTTPSASATNSSSSSGSSGGSSSKAWIAGPVIGGLAAVAIAFAGLFFWRRRRTVAAGGGERGEEKAFVPVDQRDMMGSPEAHELPRYPVSEMEAAESRHELPGN